MTNLQWVREGDTCLLKDQEMVLIDLRLQHGGNASFFIQQKKYTITRKGFWIPVHHLVQNNVPVLKMMHGFWGSNAKIVFEDGSTYGMEYRNKNGLQIIFLDGDQEILSYGTVLNEQQPVMSFHIGIAMEDAEKLLLLAALGMTISACIFKENSSDDAIITMIA